MTTNPFLKSNDETYVEQINGALAIFALGKPQFIINMPDDYDEGDYDEGLNKVGPMVCNLILSNTEINENVIRLITGQTSGTAIFRVYPNIDPFKVWRQILWTKTATTGTITCDLKKDYGATMVNDNIANPANLLSESIGYEYVDFVFTLTQVSGDRPTLDTVEIKFDGGL